MNRYFLIFFTLILGFSSCNEDEDTSENNLLFGEWLQIEIIKSDGSLLELNECQLQETIEFRVNGNLIRKNWAGAIPCEYSNLIHHFEINDDIFIVSQGALDGETFIVKNRILTINDTTLKFEIIYSSLSGNIPEGERLSWVYTKIE